MSSDDEDQALQTEGAWDRLKGEDYITALHNKSVVELRKMITALEIDKSYWVVEDAAQGNKLDHCKLARARDAVAAWAEAQREEESTHMFPWEEVTRVCASVPSGVRVCVCTCFVCLCVRLCCVIGDHADTQRRSHHRHARHWCRWRK